MKKSIGFTGNQLKLFAMVCMTFDHMVYLFPFRPNLCVLLRIIGRLAFPIFAWMIAEGCCHTRSMGRYFGTLALCGLLYQLVYGIFLKSLYMCVMVTFAISVGLIWLVQIAKMKKTVLSYVALFGGLLAAFFASEILPDLLPREWEFAIDYDFCGIVLPLCVYLCREKWQKLLAAGGVLALMAAQSLPAQWFALCSLPFLALYNGQRGKWKMKWLFYIYYPVHLVVIYGLALLLYR